MHLNAAIWAAMKSQELGNGDDETALALLQLYDLAKKYFPGLMEEVKSIYLRACERKGRTAVVDKLTKLSDQKPIVENYFETHNANVPVPENERTKLGPDMMSFTLQAIDHPTLKYLFMANGSALENARSKHETEQVNRVTTSVSENWRKRELTVGSCGDDEILGAFKDSKALQITLLLNCLLNSEFWQELKRFALGPSDFRIYSIGEETEAEEVFRPLITNTNRIFKFLNPILGVTTCKNPGDGGTTDILVEVCGWNERQELHSECTAILELTKPCMAYRAANSLVFGDKPLKEDYSALERYIAIVDPLSKEKIKEASTQLELSSSGLSKVYQPLVKRAIVSRDENNKAMYGYARNEEDITDKLWYCSLKRPVDGFHSGLGNVSRRACLDGCPQIAVSDGFTIIAMHLRDLQEQASGLVEANFNSHCAIDLTETGSSLLVFQYNVNAAYRSGMLRRGVEILLHAAHGEFGTVNNLEQITTAKSAAFGKQLKILSDYKFHSRAYTHFNSVASARIFTRHRIPIIKGALARFQQVFPALTQCGEYESSAFGILGYFKVSGFQVLESENSDPGRSRRVTKVNFYGHDEPAKSKHKETGVLKEYECDAASVERMERELEAYRRIAQLTAVDQRRFAKLIAFGAIDVDGADPRLFILTEYVEDCRSRLPSTEEDGMKEDYETFKKRQIEERTEIHKVYDLLKSVGVYHNDLEERNFRWQEVDGEHFIKVFDFDYATFDDISSGIACK